MSREKRAVPDSGGRRLSEQSVFLLLAGFQLLLFLLLIFFGNVKYEVSDDFVVEMMLSGTYTGTPDARLLFGNSLLGLILMPLYRLFPSVSWYFWGQCLTCLAAYLAVCRVLSRETDALTAAAAAAVLAAFTARDLYLLPQFTKTACAAVISGGVLFVRSLYRGGTLRELLAGALLAVFGSLFRFNTVYMAGSFLLIWFLYCFFTDAFRSGASRKRTLRRLAAAFTLLTLLFALEFWNRRFRCLEPEYRDYYEYSVVRAEVIDYYPWPAYEDCEEAFAEAGVSRNDYDMILNWCLSDDTVFTADMLERVRDVMDLTRKNIPFSLREVFHEMRARGIHRYPGALCCLTLGLLLILKKPKAAWVPVSAAVRAAALFLYFHWIRRYVYRVEFGFFFSAAAVICCFFGTSVRRGKTILSRVCFLAAMLAAVSQVRYYLPDRNRPEPGTDAYRRYVDEVFSYSWNFSNERYTRQIGYGTLHPEFLKEVRGHPERVYVLDFQTAIQNLYYDFSPFASAASVFPKNVMFLGGVAVRYPSVEAYAKRLGFPGWLKSLADPSVYFVCSRDTDWVSTYFREHGDTAVRIKEEGETDGYRIWKILPVS